MRPFLRFASSVAVLVLVTLLLAPPRASSETERSRRAAEAAIVRWEKSKFPPQIRDQIFLTTASVPVFPVNDPRLLRPKTWPETMVIGGVQCARRIHGREGDDAFPLKSADVDPGVELTLFYDHQSTSKWNSGNAGWGPQYSWNGARRLTQRIWYEPDSTRLSRKDYSYYKNGRLLGYSWRNEPRNASRYSTRSHEFLSQFFDEDGRLIAVCYEKMTPGARDSMYSWAGAELPYDDFRMKCHALYSNAHPGDR